MDDHKTREQLLSELKDLRRRLDERNEPEADRCARPGDAYRILIDTSPDPIILYDLEGRILAANLQTARTYGVSSVEAFLGEAETIFDLLVEESRASARVNFRHTIAVGESLKSEYVVRLRDGRLLDVEINSSTVRTAAGKPRAFISVIRDISDRKRMERALRVANQQLDAHIDNSPLAIVAFDRSFRIVRWSGAAERIFGWKAGEVLGKAIGEFKWVYEEDARSVESVSDGMLSGNLPQNLHINRNYRKDGSIIHCEWYNSAIYDERGRLSSIFSAILDITDRHRAEEALREREETFRVLAQSSPTAIMLYRDDRWIYANPAAERISGYPLPELLSMHFWDFIHPSYQERVRERGRKRQRGEPTLPRYEVKIVTKGGREKWLEASGASTTMEGRPAGIVSFVDITDRKKAAKALGESEKRYRRSAAQMKIALQVAQSGSFDWNLQTGTNIWTDEVKLLHGLRPEESFESYVQWAETVITEDLAPTMDCFRSTVRQGGSAVVKYRIRRRDNGEVRWLENRFRAYDESGHTPERIIGVVTDITDRLRMEEEKDRIETEYQQLQKTESLGRMAGAIAHHFNNLLGAVLGNLELAMLKLPEESDVSANLTGAMKAGRRAAEVSLSMLTYLGQANGRPEPLDLSALCRLNLPVLRDAMPREVELETNLPVPGPSVDADAPQVRQVLTNLVTNAWEAMGEGCGVVRLTVRAVSAAEIPPLHRVPLNWQPRDVSYACLEVADSGGGIGEEDVDKLFDPFYSSKFTGRGLGLPVVLGVVRAHGGGITVDSSLGRGSIFRVFLPLSDGGVPVSPEEAAGIVDNGTGGTVLLAEDDPAMRETAKAMLVRMGFAVIEAKDGMEAERLFLQHRDLIRCVLCDLTMPYMDGWETLEALRRISPRIPVILVSGYDRAQAMAGEHSQWPQAFLNKPYRMVELRAVIREALSQSEQGGTS